MMMWLFFCIFAKNFDMKKSNLFILAMMAAVGALMMTAACSGGDNYSPKPKGYMRITLPTATYAYYDTTALPFRFEASTAATVSLKRDNNRLKWVDINYPDLAGVIYLTYIPLRKNGDLAGEIDTSAQLLSKHYPFASGVDEQQFVNNEGHVYGSLYTLKGQNVASTCQFWLTDSVHHFLRGSLYIDCVPNNDSLAPVLTYLQNDIGRLIETMEWK